MSIILDEAKNVVYSRQASYGVPEDNFATTAELWSAYLGTPIRPEDVGMMMILLKVARERYQHKKDNLVDIAGYAECVARLHEKGRYINADIATRKVRSEKEVLRMGFSVGDRVEVNYSVDDFPGRVGIVRDIKESTFDPIELFESITSGKLYQIIIGNTKYIKRETRSWVGCDCCGRDIKFGTKNSGYFQKGKSGKRFCIDCFGDLARKSIFDGKPITIDFK